MRRAAPTYDRWDPTISQVALKMQQDRSPARLIDDVGAPRKTVDFACCDCLEELITADGDVADVSVGERS